VDIAATNRAEGRALAIDIDRPFQQVLAAWLAMRGYRVRFCSLAAIAASSPPELMICELAQPRATGVHTLQLLARLYPRAQRLVISARFLPGASRIALARQLGAHAALAKPFSRSELYLAIDSARAACGNPDSQAVPGRKDR
jgi:CheY-like chemotaxis protein